MKKQLYYIVALLTVALAHAQENDANDKAHIGKFEERWNFYYVQPFATGDNVLAKANDGKFGLGTSLSVFTAYGFYANVGLEFNQYKVTDVSLASNVKYTNITKAYFEVMYKYHIAPKVSLNPKIGMGYASITNGSKRFGGQDAVVYNLGFNVDYKLTGMAFFAGMNYGMIRSQVETVPQYKDFYQNLNTINIVAGIKL